MEQNIAQEAADTIDKLFEAVVSPDGRELSASELRRALEVADSLRDGEKYEKPEVGDTMYDGRCPVTIKEVTDYTARLYHIENGDGPRVSEYETNKDCDPQAPVVKVSYPGCKMTYAMPLDRLTWEQPSK